MKFLRGSTRHRMSPIATEKQWKFDLQGRPTSAELPEGQPPLSPTVFKAESQPALSWVPSQSKHPVWHFSAKARYIFQGILILVIGTLIVHTISTWMHEYERAELNIPDCYTDKTPALEVEQGITNTLDRGIN